ncbi:SIP domain-containing protein [Microbacterium sp.]|uniref:SIP domain-containing protein n=1 Tax=Microbacterium sp. TaxID=51671 RepID=UPI0039E38A1C
MGFEYRCAPCWQNLDGAVLFAGDPADLPAIAEAAAEVPCTTHVTVLIEASAPLPAVDLPPHASLIWLVRGEPGTSHPAGGRGARLGLAVHAWCAEWACSDPAFVVPCTVWLGPRTSPHVVRMAKALVGAD